MDGETFQKTDPPARGAAPLVRFVNRIRYTGKAMDNGVMWDGGILGGQVWIRRGSRRYALEMAATVRQQWALRTYHESFEYIARYEQACADEGRPLPREGE
jgi:hypothetical protein